MTNNNSTQLLQSIFGFPSFRGRQSEIIDTIVAGQDAFVLMPTGAGKSLCYQIPAMMRPGVGIVVSPLIALMQNQVHALELLGIKAAYLNSSLNADDTAKVESSLIKNRLDLLYVAPERLMMPRFLELLSRSNIALFAIDEAHCVSQWGHDFRPEYAKLSVLQKDFPGIPRIALTATADSLTRKDIIKNLGLHDAPIFVTGFDRPNIQYRVVEKDNAKKQLLHFINSEHVNDSGIVYCLSRRGVDDTTAFLKANGVNAHPYHAGMSNLDRHNNQKLFLEDEGIVIVATIAFGMGIDKPNIRFVSHLNLPKSLEEYYQETGRAGRDGKPANAWMSYGLQDVIIHRQRLNEGVAASDQKLIEQRKLEAMLGYSETTSCRRERLLKYFSDNYQGPCNNCDTCLSPNNQWDATVEVQKALSCVVRTKQIFGAAHLIDVLMGKPTEKIKRFSHDNLSVFGIGKDYPPQAWRSVYRQLIAMGYLNIDHEGFGSFKLTPLGVPILKGDQVVHLRQYIKPKRTPAKKSSQTTLTYANLDTKLFDQLRALRTKLARQLKVPPYLIFHDRSIKEMAENKPKTHSDLACIYGVGTNKLDKYGDDFLRVVNNYTA